MHKSQVKDALESIIDQNSLSSLLQALAEVCEEKATHVLDNWQDKALAAEWTGAARKIERALAGVLEL
jgi:hypothetical protein